MKETTTGDTLCDEAHPIALERIEFYEPVTSVAVEPKSRADQEKMDFFLQKLVEEDPTFRVKYDEDTGQTIISGMGELHLDVIVRRLLDDFNVSVNVGKPQVVYRETITDAAEGGGEVRKGNRRGDEFRAGTASGGASPPGLGNSIRPRFGRRDDSPRFPPRASKPESGSPWETASWPDTRSST